MKKKTSKDIINDVKGQNPSKINFTFRLSEERMKAFTKKCEVNGVKATPVLEQLIQRFLDE